MSESQETPHHPEFEHGKDLTIMNGSDGRITLTDPTNPVDGWIKFNGEAINNIERRR